jgi:hypothetical protein
MNPNHYKAFLTGYERLAAWSDVLDRINVFPVADGDTGRNLLVSFAPLRNAQNQSPEKTASQLLFSARGNSGNIATRFINDLLTADTFEHLCQGAGKGAQNARQAISNPRAGTMLTVMENFAATLANRKNTDDPLQLVEAVTDAMQDAVDKSTGELDELKAANVVDAGALGMFVFLEGFLKSFFKSTGSFRAVHEIFADRLKTDPAYAGRTDNGFCVDAVLELSEDRQAENILSSEAESLTVYSGGRYAKIHLHTQNSRQFREKIGQMGRIVSWHEDDMDKQVKAFKQSGTDARVHIVTDAAGSITRELAGVMNITLLESYVTLGDLCIPETCINPEELYASMRKKIKASTSQASEFERHQLYSMLVSRHEHVIYLCVGSVYTGNWQVATEWKKENDSESRFEIIDTGAASGRLAAVVIATARYASRGAPAENVLEFARNAIEDCGEYIFIDELKYLAAGGRMSKTGAFFGDMLHMKPVISPLSVGAEKVGIVRNTDAQIRFAEEKLKNDLISADQPLIILEYTDNRDWVEGFVRKKIQSLFPGAEILLLPLSVTSGVHIGPGAWAVAYCKKNPLS